MRAVNTKKVCYSASGGALTQCRMGRAISAALRSLVTVFPAVLCCLFCFAFFFFNPARRE